MSTLNDRSWTSGKFALTVDGHKFGFLQKIEGPKMIADVADHKMGPQNFNAKNVTLIKWGDLKMRSGIGMSKGMYMWMKDAFDMNLQYKTGALEIANFNYDLQRRVDLDGMLITGVAFPSLDASSKENGYLDLTVAIEKARWMPSSGKLQGEVGYKQKEWHVANFRSTLWGLPMTRVSKIEGLKWSCKTVMDHVGEQRENQIIATSSTIDDFKIKMSAKDFAGWEPKLKDWFINGKCADSDEGTLIIDLLGPDMNKVLGTITFMNVGLKEADFSQALEAQSEKAHHFEMSLYAQQCTFVPNYTDG